MIKPRFDVAIVGAGPSGTAAAIHAALCGLKVILLEKNPGPQQRPGESLPPGTEVIFKQLGVWETISKLDIIRNKGHYTCEDNQSIIFHPYGFDARGQWLDLQIPRYRLETILQNRAIELGVTLLYQFQVKHLHLTSHEIYLSSQQQLICADYAIDATGHCHFFARKMAIDIVEHSPKLIARYGYLTNFPHKNLPIFIRNNQGWKWYAQVGHEHYAWVSVTDKKIKTPDPYKALGGADVTWRIAKKVAKNYCFLIGDAACVHDPSSGKGVLRAMMTGIMAAHIIDNIKKNKIAEEEAYQHYHNWLNNWFHSDTRELLKRKNNLVI